MQSRAMAIKIGAIFTFSTFICSFVLVRADHLHEIRVLTSDCGDCGMAAFFGQLSVKVCIIKFKLTFRFY